MMPSRVRQMVHPVPIVNRCQRKQEYGRHQLLNR
jgi:hypothetical protein